MTIQIAPHTSKSGSDPTADALERIYRVDTHAPPETDRVQMHLAMEAGAVVMTPRAKRLAARQAGALRTAWREQIERGHRHLIVDLGHVEYMDSSALATLVSALQRVGPEGSFAVRRLHDRVRALFARTRLDRVIAIIDPARAADGPAAIDVARRAARSETERFVAQFQRFAETFHAFARECEPHRTLVPFRPATAPDRTAESPLLLPSPFWAAVDLV
jgi:anti-sigma B factor antagonist